MGGLNLEVFKFGMYVMFPIGIMYYFGTNLDERFAVPGFWPKAENMNRVPTDRDEIHAELQRLRARRLYFRDRRWEGEEREAREQGDREALERIAELRARAMEREGGGSSSSSPSAGGAAGEKKSSGWRFW